MEILPSLKLTQVMPGQLVSFQCKVLQISSADGTMTKRQEAIIVDHTASSKFLMWGTAVGSMELHKSYVVKKAHLRKDQQGQFYVNTAKNGETTIEIIEDLTGQLAEIDTASMLTIREIPARIIDINNLHKIINCCICGKVAKAAVNPNYVKCETANCGMLQLASGCTKNWFFKIALMNLHDPTKRIQLAVFHNVATS